MDAMTRRANNDHSHGLSFPPELVQFSRAGIHTERRKTQAHERGENEERRHEQRNATGLVHAAQHAESCWGGGIIIIIPVVEDTMLPRPLHWNRDFDWSILD